MMNILEEAIIYATVLHQGKVRKFSDKPYILHPMEVAQILSTMTDDQEIITSGILHDIVEDTDGTLEEIEKRFGKRVALLVSSESEKAFSSEDRSSSWKKRKEQSLAVLKNSTDIGVKMLWLADKLANIRSLAGEYSENGEQIWKTLNQTDPAMQQWYYRSIAEQLELSLNKTGAFKELIKHINFIWPGTFDSEKARYRKYREVSIDGCKLLGRGAKGEVYRYDDELVIKVFNQKNTYRDVEREIALARKTFIMGVPTAISFGIVSVGDRYGAMYELVDSETVSSLIGKDAGQVETYAKIMAELAKTIHGITVTDEDGFAYASERLNTYIEGGVALEDEKLAERCRELFDTMRPADTLVHGDFHTGNVFMQNGEPILIDMDRVSRGHPIVEISDSVYFYRVLGEYNRESTEKFMGFSYETEGVYFNSFLRNYLGTDDERLLREVTEKAMFIAYVRLVNMLWKHGTPGEEDRRFIDRCLEKIRDLADRYDTLTW